MTATDQRRVDTPAPNGTLSKSWQRFLLPSVRDLIFLLALWALLIGPLSNRPLADADIGWHIRTGEQILATHSVPQVDSFSSTMQGQPWFAWEWLYDALLGVVHRSMGLNGVVWLAALLMATTFAILFWHLLARGTGLPVAMGLMLVASAVATIVNPYGLRLHEHIYRYLSDPYLMNRIAEFRSPDFHGWGQRCFVVILALVLIAAAGSHRKMRLSHWLVVSLTA